MWMFQDTIIVGCSYVWGIKENNYNNIFGSPGAGNQAIASSALHELSKFNTTHPKNVVILWSGINRIDMPINKIQDELFRSNPREQYPYRTQVGDTVWYHSGGLLGSWQADAADINQACPKPVRDYFHLQYKGSTSRYLTDNSLRNIAGVQGFLESKNINYKMSFIYDIHVTGYQDMLESTCGLVDTSSPYFNLINWDKFENNTPYEWCRDNNLLDDDNWHWSAEGQQRWFSEFIGLDLKS